MSDIKLYHGPLENILPTFPENSIDSIVTDPPYGLKFMNRKWDYQVPTVDQWRECLRVLKPGGHLLAFAGTRTQHRMCVNIEDAGFEIRDMLGWIYGSGFPKSLNVSKAINKKNNVEFEEEPARGVGFMNNTDEGYNTTLHQLKQIDESTPEAKQWEGWGTALKPAMEVLTLARKPLSEKTIVENIVKWGTGAINIDGCRVHTDEELRSGNGRLLSHVEQNKEDPGVGNNGYNQNVKGRFPANIMHDGSDEVLEIFPHTKKSHPHPRNNKNGKKDSVIYGKYNPSTTLGFDDGGSAARFFYCSKASKADRNEGMEDQEHHTAGECTGGRKAGSAGLNSPRAGAGRTSGSKNYWPTVKPTKLMQYLIRLITPPGGTLLDPFCGSGSTGKAAIKEGFDCILIDKDKEACDITSTRLNVGYNKPVSSFDPAIYQRHTK